ncbi:hypothetical protein HAX54_030891 [Datura stramonium]|uniref:Aminotransferase-like plant mobile domain-containing protein n=1 Tax=Datura stramonium TaxID=4076 RepID=A0ABS8VBT9_DATST|nr:hypothetical protein [Datura stramonium]
MTSSSSSSSLKVQFRGRVMHMNGWSKWVEELRSLYGDTWKKAGIFEAITASTFKIYLHDDLIIALAERWRLETNTSILPKNMGRSNCYFGRYGSFELYNPHRVSVQFVFDQDVPGCVNHAWRNSDRPIKDANLYIPSRLFESDVGRRYLEWWKNQNVAPAVKRILGQLFKTHGWIPRMSWGHYEKLNASVCCEFVQKCDKFSTVDNIEDCEMRAVESSDDDDSSTILELSRRRRPPKRMNYCTL